MQKRLFHLTAYLFFCVPFCAAQKTSSNAEADSLLFDNYFSSYLLLSKTQPAIAIDSLEKIKTLATNNNYYLAINRYYLEKAAWFLSNKKNDSAINCYQSAIQLAKQENNERELGTAYLSLANLYQYNGNTLAAAENYLNATRLLKNLGRKRTLIGLYRNLFTILSRLQQKNGALQNMLSAVIANKSSSNDLIEIINTKSSEEEGFNFPDQSLVKEVGADAIYVIFGNAKFIITRPETLGSYGSVRDVQRIPSGTLALLPDFPRNGSILRELTDKYVFIAKDGLLYRIATPEVLENYGSWDAVYYVPPGSLKNFPKSTQQVTPENVNTVFNLKQQFDNLTDSIQTALQKNRLLSNELSRTVADRNNTLQKRKILLWASAVGLTALLLIVFLLLRNFRQKQKLNVQSMQALKAEQELQRKMELEKERTRIATDMHDDLGAGLSRIKFLSETIGIKKQQQLPVEEEISSIRQYSHEMIDKMGEIVWALNEKNDSLSDLLSYTRSYTVEYLSQNGIQCNVVTPDDFSLIQLSGEFRRNIYLSVKEALHNIVKHAQASLVTVKIEIDKQIVIVIKDDGIGFDPNNARPYSNGLTNIKKRMVDISGHMEIKTDNGTSLHLSAPLPA